MLIHWPIPRMDKYEQAWRALIDARADGEVRSIGVSNFTREHLTRIIDATGVVPVLDQIELHPYFPQQAQREVNHNLGICTEAWSPSGSAARCSASPRSFKPRTASRSQPRR